MDVSFSFFFPFPRGPQLSPLIHVFVCVCAYLCVCVCVRVGVHTHACTCQLAECRPWRLFCSMTCTGTEMTKIPFITISLCVSPSYFLLYVPDLHHPVIARVFILYFFFILIIKMVFLEFCQPLQLPFPFHTAGLRLFLFSKFFFLDVAAIYSPFHSRTLPVSPPLPCLM